MVKISFNLSDNTCASSVGGPGLNFGEHIAGRSTFGTGGGFSASAESSTHSSLRIVYSPRNPSSPLSSSGSASSALTPQTTVVFPILTSAEPSAVDIEPFRNQEGLVLHQNKKTKNVPTFTNTSLNSRNERPSGRTSSAMYRSRYARGCNRWKTAALSASCSS